METANLNYIRDSYQKYESLSKEYLEGKKRIVNLGNLVCDTLTKHDSMEQVIELIGLWEYDGVHIRQALEEYVSKGKGTNAVRDIFRLFDIMTLLQSNREHFEQIEMKYKKEIDALRSKGIQELGEDDVLG